MNRMLLLPLALLGGCRAAEPAAAPAPPAHWGYEGGEAPARWAALSPAYSLCGAGHSQSPVDLARAVHAAPHVYQPAYAAQRLTLRNNGHTVQVDYPAGSVLRVDGEALQLLQYHFHTPSEHTVDGAHLPAELHLVHRGPRGLAVLGVMIREGAENPAYAPLIDRLPAAAGEERALEAEHQAETLLPASRDRVFRYAGSLTTPPCSEGVDWHVLAQPVELSAAQLARLRAVMHDNSRPTQPLGDRVLRVEEP